MQLLQLQNYDVNRSLRGLQAPNNFGKPLERGRFNVRQLLRRNGGIHGSRVPSRG